MRFLLLPRHVAPPPPVTLNAGGIKAADLDSLPLARGWWPHLAARLAPADAARGHAPGVILLSPAAGRALDRLARAGCETDAIARWLELRSPLPPGWPDAKARARALDGFEATLAAAADRATRAVEECPGAGGAARNRAAEAGRALLGKWAGARPRLERALAEAEEAARRSCGRVLAEAFPGGEPQWETLTGSEARRRFGRDRFDLLVASWPAAAVSGTVLATA